ncbi:hypothetical protein [Neisseria meningitidis serogroup B]|uniref:Uncharacterized protein n=1 Tax=Neisseria meningitidis serogroup B TaxID=491 RepID=A0A0H5DM37_NEIMI|nr:hypothetical protein [Neisseria meningitidis serogroup B]
MIITTKNSKPRQSKCRLKPCLIFDDIFLIVGAEIIYGK